MIWGHFLTNAVELSIFTVNWVGKKDTLSLERLSICFVYTSFLFSPDQMISTYAFYALSRHGWQVDMTSSTFLRFLLMSSSTSPLIKPFYSRKAHLPWKDFIGRMKSSDRVSFPDLDRESVLSSFLSIPKACVVFLRLTHARPRTFVAMPFICLCQKPAGPNISRAFRQFIRV